MDLTLKNVLLLPIALFVRAPIMLVGLTLSKIGHGICTVANHIPGLERAYKPR